MNWATASIRANNGEGKFSITPLPPGEYTLSLERVGFVFTAPFNSAASRSTRFTLGPGDRKDDLKLTLTPVGAITGHVFDAAGEPVQGANVVAEGGNGNGASSTTDDAQGTVSAGRHEPRPVPRESLFQTAPFPPEIRSDGTADSRGAAAGQRTKAPIILDGLQIMVGRTAINVKPDAHLHSEALATLLASWSYEAQLHRRGNRDRLILVGKRAGNQVRFITNGHNAVMQKVFNEARPIGGAGGDATNTFNQRQRAMLAAVQASPFDIAVDELVGRLDRIDSEVVNCVEAAGGCAGPPPAIRFYQVEIAAEFGPYAAKTAEPVRLLIENYLAHCNGRLRESETWETPVFVTCNKCDSTRSIDGESTKRLTSKCTSKTAISATKWSISTHDRHDQFTRRKTLEWNLEFSALTPSLDCAKSNAKFKRHHPCRLPRKNC